jgi:hypothetical protein
MDELARNVAALVVVMAAGVGPVATAILLLNRRDRRAAALMGLVTGALPPVAVRSDLAIAVRSGLVGPWSTVTVDMRMSTPEDVWDAIGRLRRVLPRHVALRVVSRIGRQRPAALTARRLGPAGLTAVEVA